MGLGLMGVLIIAGASSSGKTTVGRGVADACRAQFLDADDLHSAANVAKMHAEIPLTDDDRGPWLDVIRARIVDAIQSRRPLVIAASCLERAHRRYLIADATPAEARVAFLVVSFETAFARARHRHHAFFPESLVRSQFEALELPADDEPNVRLFDGEKPLDALVAEISGEFHRQPLR
jgi:gluconokinase